MDFFRRKMKAVASLDLGAVSQKATERHKWTESQAAEAEADYRRFLYLLAKYPDKVFVPWNDDLDKFWHEHIVDTRRYQNDCQKVFGKFIHHNPHISQNPSSDRRAKLDTKELYRKEFIGGSTPSDPSMLWAVASVAGIAAFGYGQASAIQRDEEEDQRKNSNTGVSSGCATVSSTVSGSCPTESTADAGACGDGSGSSDGGGSGCGSGGGGCGGGGCGGS